eukprot:CAMPEP_0172662526 /NCGR_PEP_ID=MMETSP1074-20121228/5412_1 /TAXON_ID=2916 /ORGANISM="Ceratium fusus, Strain PA161109" /LENGTH=272 /DNA_ID=CAMNT_0013478449 /DNA_START=92 /DNA_END=910 /DNA_ORIENTATION=+
MELVPTVSPDNPDVQDAWVLTDRRAPVSKYRLAACLAGALFLACVPAAALLHWPHQMQAELEAKTVQYGNQEKAGVINLLNASQRHELKQLPPLRILVPTVPGYSKAPHVAWTIRWASDSSKCLTIKGDKSGAALNFASCDFSSPDHQHFILPPPNSNGEIRWFKHPELCLENPLGVFLQMWKCSTSQKEKRMFRVEPDKSNVMVGVGGAAPPQHSRIHFAAQPSKCLDIPNGSPGSRAQLWDCDEHKVNTNVQPLPNYHGPGSVFFRVSYH